MNGLGSKANEGSSPEINDWLSQENRFGALTPGAGWVMLHTLKVRDVIDRLHREGWILARQRGSHRQFVNPDFPARRVTVAGHPHLDLPKGTLNSIFKQAGWK